MTDVLHLAPGSPTTARSIVPGSTAAPPTERCGLLIGAEAPAGRAVARRLAVDSAITLTIAGHDRPTVRAIAAALRTESVMPCTAITFDGAGKDQLARAIDAACARFDRLDVAVVLVTSPGIRSGGPALALSNDAIRADLEEHVLAPLQIVRAVTARMARTDGGRIVVVSSLPALGAAGAGGPMAGGVGPDLVRSAFTSVLGSLATEVRSLGVRLVGLAGTDRTAASVADAVAWALSPAGAVAAGQVLDPAQVAALGRHG